MEASTFEAAERERELGNTLFKGGEYAKANAKYKEALDRLDTVKDVEALAERARESTSKCRLNRAACLLKLQGYAAAGREASLVIGTEPSNAKAHFRAGQAANHLGDYPTALKMLTEAIKLGPSLREPRDLLEKLKSRLKGNPRLEQAIADMMLVEERALRALNTADIKRARQQLELLLKDARSHQEAHWECRALLGLALLCQDEGEPSAAMDYIDAARRKLTAEDDKRAEVYCLQTTALVYIDDGKLETAKDMLEGGLLLAQEMEEQGLVDRLTANLAYVYMLCQETSRAVEYILEARTMPRSPICIASAQ